VLPASVAERLGVQDLVSEIFFPEIMLPGAGQGLIAVLARKGDTETIEMAREIHSTASCQEMLGELAFRERICSDQSCPMGVLAQVSESEIVITGAIGSTSHASFNQAVLQGPAADALELGHKLAEKLLMNTTSLIDLLEADFPEGLPSDSDDDDDEDLMDGELDEDDVGNVEDDF
jgi:hydroxymethylbilane synthase